LERKKPNAPPRPCCASSASTAWRTRYGWLGGCGGASDQSTREAPSERKPSHTFAAPAGDEAEMQTGLADLKLVVADRAVCFDRIAVRQRCFCDGESTSELKTDLRIVLASFYLAALLRPWHPRTGPPRAHGRAQRGSRTGRCRPPARFAAGSAARGQRARPARSSTASVGTLEDTHSESALCRTLIDRVRRTEGARLWRLEDL
jgi:hypothetical protein